jgi:hypothetical protein
MKITFKDTEYEIPDTIDLLSPGDLAWINILFETLIKDYKNPMSLWEVVYSELFQEPLLKDEHKYGICVFFSSKITESYLVDEFNNTLQKFAGLLEKIQQPEAMSPLILP